MEQPILLGMKMGLQLVANCPVARLCISQFGVLDFNNVEYNDLEVKKIKILMPTAKHAKECKQCTAIRRIEKGD